MEKVLLAMFLVFKYSYDQNIWHLFCLRALALALALVKFLFQADWDAMFLVFK